MIFKGSTCHKLEIEGTTEHRARTIQFIVMIYSRSPASNCQEFDGKKPSISQIERLARVEREYVSLARLYKYLIHLLLRLHTPNDQVRLINTHLLSSIGILNWQH